MLPTGRVHPGNLTRSPEQRTSAKGIIYTTAVMLVGEGNAAAVCNIIAFGELAPVLAELSKGDGLTGTGSAKLNGYEAKDGSGPRAGLSVTAARIITIADTIQPPRLRTGNQPRQRQLE